LTYGVRCCSLMLCRKATRVSIRRDSPLPLYYQIREILRQEISSKRLPLGALFPSESQLMERFSVSRTTVRKALDDLAVEGVLHRVQGQGTFVRSCREGRQILTMGSLVRDVAARGSKLVTRVMRIESRQADAELARCLELEPGEAVTYIERLRLVDEIPLSFDLAWLPAEAGLVIVQDDLTVYSITDLLEDRLRLRLGQASYTIEAAIAEGDIADALQVRTGFAILLVERTDCTLDQAPILHHRWHSRTDHVRFALQLR